VMVPASVRRAPDPAKIDWICLVQPTAATACASSERLIPYRQIDTLPEEFPPATTGGSL
jgi:hypothetical protein